jgi:hypothetical protein
MMLFCAAGLVALGLLWPKYSKRQARLELQYHAGQEITRRKAQGEPQAREVGHEGQKPPPGQGELIVTLWPIAAALVGLLVISATMYWRGHRTRPQTLGATPGGPP